jgi:hypothetical protein
VRNAFFRQILAGKPPFRRTDRAITQGETLKRFAEAFGTDAGTTALQQKRHESRA